MKKSKAAYPLTPPSVASANYQSVFLFLHTSVAISISEPPLLLITFIQQFIWLGS